MCEKFLSASLYRSCCWLILNCPTWTPTMKTSSVLQSEAFFKASCLKSWQHFIFFCWAYYCSFCSTALSRGSTKWTRRRRLEIRCCNQKYPFSYFPLNIGFSVKVRRMSFMWTIENDWIHWNVFDLLDGNQRTKCSFPPDFFLSALSSLFLLMLNVAQLNSILLPQATFRFLHKAASAVCSIRCMLICSSCLIVKLLWLFGEIQTCVSTWKLWWNISRTPNCFGLHSGAVVSFVALQHKKVLGSNTGQGLSVGS